MYSTQVPYSALDTEADLAPTKANFPALEHFFQCKETSGTTLTDAVGGVVLTPPTLSFPGTGRVTLNTTQIVRALTAGSWATIGTKTVLWMIVGNLQIPGGVDLQVIGGIGGTSGLVINLIAGIEKTISDDGTNTINGTRLTGGALAAQGVLVRQNIANGHEPFESVAGASLATIAKTATTNLAWAGNQPADTYQLDVGDMYGQLIMMFDNPPSYALLEAAIPWMYNEWVVNDNKVIYPGFKNVT